MADDDNTPSLLEVISRAEAKAKGLTRYFTGRPCKHGHVAERSISGHGCVVCGRAHSAAHSRKKHKRLQISAEAAAAKAAGLTKYFDGKPCKHGHISERWVGNHGCVECNRLRCLRYVEANREKINAKSRAKDAADPEKKARRMRDYYERNVEKIAASSRKKRIENLETYAAYQRNRLARKKAAEGSHTAEDIDRIYKAQKGKCACCREKVGKSYHVDHIVPLAKGGSNAARNLQILCQPCNNRKHAHDPITFMQRQGFLL